MGSPSATLTGPHGGRGSPKRIAELDGVRAMAILAVLGLHLNVPLSSGGYLGVDVFFVLSGFLITSLMETEFVESGRIDLLAFFLRRSLRLFPALVVLLVVSLVLVLINTSNIRPERFGTVAVSVALYASNWVQALSGADQFGTLQHTWSLAIEEQFYLIWPPLFLFLRKRFPLRRIRCWLIVAVCVSAVDLAVSWDGERTPAAYYRTDCRIGAILMGAALALYLTHPPVLKMRARRNLQISGVVALIILLFMMMKLSVGTHAALAFHVGIAGAWLLTALVIAMLVIAPPWALRAIFGNQATKLVAMLSYSLYLWHPVLIHLVDSELSLRFSLRVALSLGLTVAVAAGSFFFVEQPFLRLKARLARSELPPKAEPLAGTDGATRR